MFNVNEYFDGKVKSISFTVDDDKATLGVMAVGEYEFATESVEHMTVSGSMTVKLPGEDNGRSINVNETFIVDASTSFLVKIEKESSYLCVYK